MDLLPHFNNVLTLINLLADNAEEQARLKVEYNRAWAGGDYCAAVWLGETLAKLGNRHLDKAFGL